jgi:hypothetical protein
MPVELVVEHLLTSVIVGGTIVALAFSPLPRAWAHRIIHGRTPQTTDGDPRVDELAEDNAMLRRQLAEMQERIEFNERVLSQVQNRGLHAGRDD